MLPEVRVTFVLRGKADKELTKLARQRAAAAFAGTGYSPDTSRITDLGIGRRITRTDRLVEQADAL